MAEDTTIYKTLEWDKSTEKLYETGVKKVALYVTDDNGKYKAGEAWNGVTSITETPSGADETKLWADDGKYLTLRSAEELGGTIEAYMYPDSWKLCDGRALLGDDLEGVEVGQQARRVFGLAYITTVGNDVQMNDYGAKLHLIYGATVSPSQRQYQSINESPEAITFSWEFSTNPVDTLGDQKPTSLITIDKNKIGKVKWNALLDVVYGKDGTGTAGNAATLPSPKEVYKIIKGSDYVAPTTTETSGS